jgi:hypothetical protein
MPLAMWKLDHAPLPTIQKVGLLIRSQLSQVDNGGKFDLVLKTNNVKEHHVREQIFRIRRLPR